MKKLQDMRRARLIRSMAAIGALTLLTSCASPVSMRPSLDGQDLALEKRDMEQLRAQSALEMRKRLFKVGNRISAANLEFCPDASAEDVGIDALRPSNLPDIDRRALAQHLGLDDVSGAAPIVVAVAVGSPAEEAGVAVGDLILDAPPSAFAGKSVMAIDGGVIRHARLRRGEEVMPVTLTPRRICDFPTRLERKQALNAYADGDGITFYTGMMLFAQDEDLLATVYAHELAHNTMKHRDAKTENATVGMVAGLAIDIAAALAGVNT